jgi:rRNA-processing protein FCF1
MVRYKIHAIEEIKKKIPSKFFVTSSIMSELNYLSKDKKIMLELKLIEKILEQNKVELIKSKTEKVDDELVDLSKDYLIATNDKELRKRIRLNQGKTIYIRKMTLVEIDGYFD